MLSRPQLNMEQNKQQNMGSEVRQPRLLFLLWSVATWEHFLGCVGLTFLVCKMG